jgi:Fur family ferric uptake transcriptional regulator
MGDSWGQLGEKIKKCLTDVCSYIILVIVIVIISIVILEVNLLSKKKMRISKQRKVILQVVQESPCHPTADEVYHQARRRLPHISLGTVYRNLEILSSSGEIKKVQLGGSQMRFDNCTEEHAHIRCVNCGRVDDLPIDPLNPCEDVIRKSTGYRVVGRCVEFVGICPACQEEGGDEAA